MPLQTQAGSFRSRGFSGQARRHTAVQLAELRRRWESSELELEVRRIVGRPLGISSPKGEGVCEIYLEVRFKPSVLGEISSVLGENKVSILEIQAHVSDDKEVGYVVIYAEMKDAKISLRRLVEKLKEKDFTIEARAEKKDSMFFENMMFPLTSGDHYRVFVVGTDEWIGMVDSLRKEFGSVADTIFHQQGIAAGEGLVVRIGSKLEKPSIELLLENTKGFFSASGLGMLELSNLNEDTAKVTIKESIMTSEKSGGEGVDYFIVGIVRGALQKIFSVVYSVDDLKLVDRTISFKLVRVPSGTVAEYEATS